GRSDIGYGLCRTAQRNRADHRRYLARVARHRADRRSRQLFRAWWPVAAGYAGGRARAHRAQNRLAAAPLFRSADCRRAFARDPAGKEWTIERKAPRIGRNSQRLNMPVKKMPRQKPVKKMPRQNEPAVSPVAATPTEPARTFSGERPVFVLAPPQ